MKNIRILVACLALIITGILFTTGSAYAASNGSKGGETACTTQIAPHGQPIIRCVSGGKKDDDSTVTTVWHHHRHHHYHRHHRFVRSWRHCHSHHHGHHSYHGSHHSCSHGHR